MVVVPLVIAVLSVPLCVAVPTTCVTALPFGGVLLNTGAPLKVDDLHEFGVPSSQIAREHKVPVRSVRIDGNGLETDAHLWTGARPTGV